MEEKLYTKDEVLKLFDTLIMDMKSNLMRYSVGKRYGFNQGILWVIEYRELIADGEEILDVVGDYFD